MLRCGVSVRLHLRLLWVFVSILSLGCIRFNFWSFPYHALVKEKEEKKFKKKRKRIEKNNLIRSLLETKRGIFAFLESIRLCRLISALIFPRTERFLWLGRWFNLENDRNRRICSIQCQSVVKQSLFDDL